MLRDHPRRHFCKIALKNLMMLGFISFVRATLHILSQLTQLRSRKTASGIKFSMLILAFKASLSKEDEERPKTDVLPSPMTFVVCTAWERCHISHPEGQSFLYVQ